MPPPPCEPLKRMLLKSWTADGWYLATNRTLERIVVLPYRLTLCTGWSDSQTQYNTHIIQRLTYAARWILLKAIHALFNARCVIFCVFNIADVFENNPDASSLVQFSWTLAPGGINVKTMPGLQISLRSLVKQTGTSNALLLEPTGTHGWRAMGGVPVQYRASPRNNAGFSKNETNAHRL